MKNIYYIAIILIIFSSCTAKKSVIQYKERIIKDTVNVFKERLVTKQVIDTLLIEEPCDSLGNLRDFEKEIRTEKAKVTLKSVNGNIQLDVNLDSIVNQRVREFQSTFKKQSDFKTVEIVRYKYPLWLIISLIVSVLLNLFFIKAKLPF